MKTWNIQRTQYKVSDFLTWYRNGELNLSPSFQRRPVWKPGAKSYLIDTVMRGLPIPAILVRDLPSDLQTLRSAREVVDGQQRIRTVISFVARDSLRDSNPADDFKISRAHNRELAGHRFSQLARTLQQHILDYQFTVHVFPSDTDDREILEIFARMNATGYKLNAQELRNATFFGEFKTLCYETAAEQLNRWRTMKLFSEQQIARMAEVELTSELAILILDGISEGSRATIDRYYRQYDETFEQSDEVAKRFRHVMDVIADRVGEVDRVPFEKKTLFYPFFASLYACSYGLGTRLRKAKTPSVSKSDLDAILAAGKKLQSGTAPATIQALTQRRVSQVGVRRKITGYLLKNTSTNA